MKTTELNISTIIVNVHFFSVTVTNWIFSPGSLGPLIAIFHPSSTTWPPHSTHTPQTTHLGQVLSNLLCFAIVSRFNIVLQRNGVKQPATGFEVWFLSLNGCVRGVTQSVAKWISALSLGFSHIYVQSTFASWSFPFLISKGATKHLHLVVKQIHILAWLNKSFVCLFFYARRLHCWGFSCLYTFQRDIILLRSAKIFVNFWFHAPPRSEVYCETLLFHQGVLTPSLSETS